MIAAVVFPGQGSQYPGMADPWMEHPAGRAALIQASEVLGEDLTAVCREPDRLADTALVQPALVACGLAAFRVLQSEGVRFEMFAGHSLGEYAALAAAGAVSAPSAVAAVVERGRAMRDAAEAVPGAMSAIIGLSPDEVDDLCRIAGRGDVLTVANMNSPVQTAVSGTVAAVERAEALARSRGAKAVRLRVSGGFHSPLMRPALDRVRRAVASMEFDRPPHPVIPNGSGTPTTSPQALRDLLSRHLISPVRWQRTMRAMVDGGVSLLVEAGPGTVLSRLARRGAPEVEARSVGSPEEAAALAREGRVAAR